MQQILSFLLILLWSQILIAAENQWQVIDEQVHPYWQSRSCWAGVDGAGTAGRIRLEVYNNREQELGRPLVQVIADVPESVYEAKLYFDNKPAGLSFEMIRLSHGTAAGAQVLTLPTLPSDPMHLALENLIKASTAHVILKNETGQVRRVNFSLSKSSLSIRAVLGNCFSHLTDKFKRI